MYENRSVGVLCSGDVAIDSHLVVAIYRVADSGEKLLEDVITDCWTYQKVDCDFIQKAKDLISSRRIVGELHFDFTVIPEDVIDGQAFSFVVKRFNDLFGFEWVGCYDTHESRKSLVVDILSL